ncbi:MAG: hypothetical protein ACOX41_09765 [Anaerovoracaceae bacterium]|jgi:hypothetical protein
MTKRRGRGSIAAIWILTLILGLSMACFSLSAFTSSTDAATGSQEVSFAHHYYDFLNPKGIASDSSVSHVAAATDTGADAGQTAAEVGLCLFTNDILKDKNLTVSDEALWKGLAPGKEITVSGNGGEKQLAEKVIAESGYRIARAGHSTPLLESDLLSSEEAAENVTLTGFRIVAEPDGGETVRPAAASAAPDTETRTFSLQWQAKMVETGKTGKTVWVDAKDKNSSVQKLELTYKKTQTSDDTSGGDNNNNNNNSGNNNNNNNNNSNNNNNNNSGSSGNGGSSGSSNSSSARTTAGTAAGSVSVSSPTGSGVAASDVTGGGSAAAADDADDTGDTDGTRTAQAGGFTDSGSGTGTPGGGSVDGSGSTGNGRNGGADPAGIALVSTASAAAALFALSLFSDFRVIRWYRRRKTKFLDGEDRS